MTITLNTLAMQLVTEMGHSISETALVTQFERYVNDACKHLINYAEWSWLESVDTTVPTVASTATYSLTTTACEIRELRIGGSYDISLIATEIENLSRADYDLELTGQPRYWYPFGYSTSTQKKAFGLWPVPGGVYSIIPYITIVASDLTSDSTIPIPENYYSCLKDGARFYMEDDQGRPQQAAQKLRMFEGSLKILRNRDYSRDGNKPMPPYTDVPSGPRGSFLPGRYPRWGG